MALILELKIICFHEPQIAESIMSAFFSPPNKFQDSLLWECELYKTQDAGDKFPFDVLPEKIRVPVFDVWQTNLTPMPLVVTSALSALSVACQHLFDVSRPNGMTSPCGLFFITIADSGERKTSIDNLFTRPIRDFEKKHLEENGKPQSDYRVSLKIWQAKEAGLKRKIQRLTSRNENCDEAEQQLRQHHQDFPEKPLMMRMLFDDVSPTAIISSLHDQWPSAGILSDEAGKLFNSKTFENIGLYNKLWDGAPVSLDRHRTTESYTVNDGRLTISLMTQQQTFRNFLAKQGALARDNGFLARCLACWPVSTQGSRLIQVDEASRQNIAPSSLAEFQRVIAFLLNQSWQRHQSKQPRKTITMSSEAARSWRKCYNQIETRLGQATYADVRDGASKAAENIARLACLFQAFESCESTEEWQIQAPMVDAANRICMWYLERFKDIFGKKGTMSDDAQNANELMQWLEELWSRNYDAHTGIPKNYVLQYGPIKTRRKNSLETALGILCDRGLLYINTYYNGHGRKPSSLICKKPTHSYGIT